MRNSYNTPISEKYFGEDVSENYLVFQPRIKDSKPFTSNAVITRKTKKLSDEIIKASDTLDNNFNQTLDNFNNPKV